MYHISDGYNLNGSKEEDTFLDNYLAAHLAKKEHDY